MQKAIKYDHVPVLLGEVVSYLEPGAGQNFVDATLGGGGYSRAILEKIQPGGKLLAIDADTEAIENAKLQISNSKTKSQSIILAHGNFRDLDKIVERHKFANIQGVVADLGLSSFQLDDSGRGISFQKRELLDMRFDVSGERIDAKWILANYSAEDLTRVFREFGEERFSLSIARELVRNRNTNKIQYTDELFSIIEKALPKPVKHKAADSARRIFQALRIAVNHELDALTEFLPKAFDLLNPGGRLVVVSFHSLEDRIVKQFFAGLAKGCVCPIDFPQCVCGKNPRGKLLTKKPITAKETEIKINSRSRPAKLRAIIKI
jgi:16S rRNA (cytosine1402-N4)-methyltransferase